VGGEYGQYVCVLTLVVFPACFESGCRETTHFITGQRGPEKEVNGKVKGPCVSSDDRRGETTDARRLQTGTSEIETCLALRALLCRPDAGVRFSGTSVGAGAADISQ